MDEHRNCDIEKQELSDQLDAKILENIALETELDIQRGYYAKLLETCAMFKAAPE